MREFFIPRRTGEVGFTDLLILGGIVLVCVLFIWLARRKRNNTPRPDPWPVVVPPLPSRPAAFDTHDAWLLGFAAPWAVAAGLNHEAWDLGTSADELRQRLPAHRPDRWHGDVRDAERALARAAAPAERAWLVSRIAWLQRLGVAGGDTDVASARRATESAARTLEVSDWLRFGDLFDEALRAHPDAPVAPPAGLYRPGAPWAAAWPRAAR